MVMTHRSSLSATWAVMVTSPGFRAFTRPSSTVAKYSLDEIQSMFLLVASSGRIVACSVYSSPTVISSVCWSSVTEVTGMTFAATVTVHLADLSPAFAVIVAAHPTRSR